MTEGQNADNEWKVSRARGMFICLGSVMHKPGVADSKAGRWKVQFKVPRRSQIGCKGE